LQKRYHYIFACNIAKGRPIFKIVLLTDLAENFYQSGNKIYQDTSNVSLLATLPCEILMSEKQHYPEIYIVINDTSQGSVAV